MQPTPDAFWKTFVRPVAHRGLHDPAAGVIENSATAVSRACQAGFAIECDLQPACDGTPMVFHDFTLNRLTGQADAIADLSVDQLTATRLKGSPDTIATLAEVLNRIAGRVPVMAEIKTDWGPPKPEFLDRICQLVSAYPGPVALKSFDPAIMAVVRKTAPRIPRGLVSARFDLHGWPPPSLSQAKAERLAHMLDAGCVAPQFFSYHVADLPTPVTRFIRQVLNKPIFGWTVRTPDELERCADHADAPIFEAMPPDRLDCWWRQHL